MKKNFFLTNDEIDLIILFKIIWDGKIKILLITLISFFVGLVYNSQTPINYLNSLTIKHSQTSAFIRLYNFRILLQINKSNELNQLDNLNHSNQIYLARFINE